VTALETGQRAYDSTRATDEILEKLGVLAEKIEPKSDSKNNPPIFYIQYGSSLRGFIVTTLQRITALRESLPKKEAKLARKSAELFEQELQRLDIKKDKIHMVNDTAFQQLEDLDRSLVVLALKVEDFEGQLVKQVATEARKDALRVERFTYWTYFLYPAGVLIGVLGQLAGVKAAGGE
jgi:hypothetical protein